MSEAENKKLSELRVVDLRAELEKRGLDKSGNKQVLLERLQKALQAEGKNPDTEVFDLSDKKLAKRLSTSSSSYQGEESTAQSEAAELTDTPSEEPKEQQQVEEEKQPEIEEESTKESTDVTIEKEEESAGGQDSPIQLILPEEDNLPDENTETSEQPEMAEASKSNGNEASTVDQPKNADETAESTKEEDSAQEVADKSQEETPETPSGANADESGTKKTPSNPKILWITNVPKNTRANELKHLLSPCGKVVCAKVVVNARFPGSCCFGYVAMGSAEDANNVIAKLNNTEFNGQIIKIDKFENVKADDLNPARKKGAEEKKSTQPQTVTDCKKDESVKANNNKKTTDEKANSKAEEKTDESSKEKQTSGSMADTERRRSLNSDRSSRGRKRSHSKEKERTRSTSKGAGGGGGPQQQPQQQQNRAGVLTFDKIKEERERQRMRDRERAMREDSRRRHEEAQRLKEMREITRRQRSEAERLEREREKLRMERDRIEREKAELLKLERERQRIEREKLEMEKIELQRSRLRLEEDRRAVKRPVAVATFTPNRREEPFEERKRNDRHFEETSHTPRFDPPPHSRGAVPNKKFASSTSSKDFKRTSYDKHDAFPEKRGGRDYDGERATNVKFDRSYDRPTPRESQSAGAPARSTKESRYSDRDRSPHYRSLTDDRDRHLGSQNKTSDREHHSYSDSNGRFERGNNWNHQVTAQSKSFSSGSGAKPWNKSGWRSENVGPERWGSSGTPSSSRTSVSQPFSGGGNSLLAPACPPPPGINNYSDRFEYNKSSSGMRKY